MNAIEELRYLINLTEREGSLRYASLLKPLNITPNQAEVLQILAKQEPLSLKELGELVICEKKSPSRLVQRLVDAGWIYKSSSADDQRKSVLQLTEKGKNLVPKVNKIEQVFNAEIQTTLAETNDLSLEQLIAALHAQIRGTEGEAKINKRKQVS